MMHQNELYESAQTGQSDVTCLSFGPQRKAMYPAYFFCHGCDLFEDAILIGNKRANRVQRRYRCTGGHEDWSHPTTLMHEYRHRSNRESTCIDTDDGEGDKHEINDSSTTRSATADYNSSPTKSPLKKKIRQYRGLASATFMSHTIGTAQQQRPRRQSSSAAFVYNYYREESSSEGASDTSGGNDEEMIGRQLFRDSSIDSPYVLESDRDHKGACNGGEELGSDRDATSSNRQQNYGYADGENDLSIADDAMEYINDLEEQNLFLRERLIKVEQHLNDKIANLEAEIKQMKAQKEEASAGAAIGGENTPMIRRLLLHQGKKSERETNLRIRQLENTASIGRMQKCHRFCLTSSSILLLHLISSLTRGGSKRVD